MPARLTHRQAHPPPLQLASPCGAGGVELRVPQSGQQVRAPGWRRGPGGPRSGAALQLAGAGVGAALLLRRCPYAHLPAKSRRAAGSTVQGAPALARCLQSRAHQASSSPLRRAHRRAFAQHYNHLVPSTWRVVNARDTVCTLPRLMGYAHVRPMLGPTASVEAVLLLCRVCRRKDPAMAMAIAGPTPPACQL